MLTLVCWPLTLGRWTLTLVCWTLRGLCWSLTSLKECVGCSLWVLDPHISELTTHITHYIVLGAEVCVLNTLGCSSGTHSARGKPLDLGGGRR